MINSDFSVSIEQTIARHAASFPSVMALKANTECMNYGQLNRAIGRCCESLGKLEGRSVAFRADCSLQAVVRYFAIHRSGGVAVPLDKNISEVAFTDMQRKLSRVHCPEETADVLFTTGTTGRPKGVMVSHKAMLANAENLVFAQGYHPGLTFVVNGPLNHLGSLSKLYTALFSGGTVRLLDGMKDMQAFFYEVENADGPVATFLVPTSIRLLMTFAEASLRQVADRFEFIETGAAPMMQTDMERLCRLLPHVRLYNTYASTETGIVTTHDYNAGLCQSGVLGKSMKHSDVVIDANGCVVCQGDTLMTGYWDDAALTEQVMTEDGLQTNDLGWMDRDGCLHLSGRSDDMINVGGFKVSPVEIEEQVMASGMVRDCICIPYEHPLAGTSLCLLVVPGKNGFSSHALCAWLRTRLDGYKLPQKVQVVDKVERNANGKLNRKYYQK